MRAEILGVLFLFGAPRFVHQPVRISPLSEHKRVVPTRCRVCRSRPVSQPVCRCAAAAQPDFELPHVVRVRRSRISGSAEEWGEALAARLVFSFVPRKRN